MQAKKKTDEKKKPLISRSSDFKTIYVTGAIGNVTPFDYRLAFYNHETQFPEAPKEWEGVSVSQVFQVELVMSFDLMKRLKELIEKQISQKEKPVRKEEGDVSAAVT